MEPNSRAFRDIEDLPAITSKDSKWVVAQMEYDGAPLIVRANCSAKDWVGHPLLSVKIGCAIPFKKPSTNGMPDQLENEQLLRVEDVILEEFGKLFSGLLVLVLTTGKMRELVFYVESSDRIDEAKSLVQLRVKSHIVQFISVHDPKWSAFHKFSPFN